MVLYLLNIPRATHPCGLSTFCLSFPKHTRNIIAAKEQHKDLCNIIPQSRSLCYSPHHPLGCGRHHLQHSHSETFIQCCGVANNFVPFPCLKVFFVGATSFKSVALRQTLLTDECGTLQHWLHKQPSSSTFWLMAKSVTSVTFFESGLVCVERAYVLFHHRDLGNGEPFCWTHWFSGVISIWYCTAPIIPFTVVIL